MSEEAKPPAEPLQIKGVVWKHEADLINITSRRSQPEYAVGHITIYVRVGEGDITGRYRPGDTIPAIGTVLDVTLRGQQ